MLHRKSFYYLLIIYIKKHHRKSRKTKFQQRYQISNQKCIIFYVYYFTMTSTDFVSVRHRNQNISLFLSIYQNVSEIELLTRDFVSSAARVDSSVNNTCHSFPNKPISAREKLYLPVWCIKINVSIQQNQRSYISVPLHWIDM